MKNTSISYSNLEEYSDILAQNAKKACKNLRTLSAEKRSAVLNLVAKMLREKKARTLERMRNTRIGWSPTNSEINTLVEGNTETNIDGDTDELRALDKYSVSKLQSMVDRQQEYIDFLKAGQEQIRYYPSNAKALTAVYQFGVEIGKIIPDENEWNKYRKKSG